MECQRACQSAAFPAIEDKLHRNTRLVLEEVASRVILPREAAVDLAVQRLKKSMSYIIGTGRCFRQLPDSYSKTQRFANRRHASSPVMIVK